MLFKLIWPILIVLGVLAVFNHGDGSGFEDPGFLLVPIGVFGGLITVSRRTTANKSHMRLLIGLWALAFLCIAYIYFADPDAFRILPWFLIAAGSTIAGWILLVFHLFRK